MLYIWTMDSLQSFGWAVVLIFAVCAASASRAFNTRSAPSCRLCLQLLHRRAGAGGGRPGRDPHGGELRVRRYRLPLALAQRRGDPGGGGADGEPGSHLRDEALPDTERMVLPTLLGGVGAFAAFLTTEPWPTLLWWARSYRLRSRSASALPAPTAAARGDARRRRCALPARPAPRPQSRSSDPLSSI